jgi:hypothetical protein
MRRLVTNQLHPVLISGVWLLHWLALTGLDRVEPSQIRFKRRSPVTQAHDGCIRADAPEAMAPKTTSGLPAPLLLRPIRS